MKTALWVAFALSSGSIISANTPWGAGPPPARTLPQGWSEHMDPSSGQPYYYNAADGTTTWDRPLDTTANATTTSNILNAAKNPQEEDTVMESQTTTKNLDGASTSTPSRSSDDKPPAVVNQDPNSNNEGGDSQAGTPPSAEGEGSTVVDYHARMMAAESSATTTRDEQNDTPDRTWREQQQPDPRGWDMEPQHQQRQGSGPWGMPPQQSETLPKNGLQHPGWNLQNRPPGEETKQPTLVDDRRNGDRPEPANEIGQQTFDPSKMQQRSSMQQMPRTQEFWRGQPQAPPGYQGVSPEQRQGPTPQQYQPGASQQQRNGPQQGGPQQQQQQQQQQQRGPLQLQQQQRLPQGGPNQRPDLRQVQRIPERQPQRPPPPGQYGGPPPNQGYGQYDGAYPGQQYYNPQQQQQQYGNQYNSYGQYGSREMMTQPAQMAGVKESLGRTWQSVLGFGNRTKEALSTASETVASNAREAGQTITTKSTGWWGQAKNALGSVFESNKGAEEYSMTGIYGNNDGLQRNRMPQQGYGGQQYGYPQQQGGQPQNYPPQYQGRPNMPPQPPGSFQMPPPGQPQGQQPPQQQGQRPPPQQQGQRPQGPGQPPQQQGQYPPPGSRYPPGYIPPNPRSDPPYAHQQQQQPASPQQRQWGLPPGSNQRPMMERDGPYGPPSPGQDQDPNLKSDEESKSKETQNGAWQHPGLGPDGY